METVLRMTGTRNLERTSNSTDTFTTNEENAEQFQSQAWVFQYGSNTQHVKLYGKK
jgi:hypothetical protein